jgi:hypothetical protein
MGVLQRQQHLRGGDAMGRQRLLIGLGEPDLADRRSGLALLQRQGAALEAKRAAAERDGAGGDDQRLDAGFREVADVGGEAGQPVSAQPAGLMGRPAAPSRS